MIKVKVKNRDGNRIHCIKFRFDQSDSSVRFRLVLSNSSGSFGSVRLAKNMGSSSVQVLFDSSV